MNIFPSLAIKNLLNGKLSTMADLRQNMAIKDLPALTIKLLNRVKRSSTAVCFKCFWGSCKKIAPMARGEGHFLGNKNTHT